MTKNHASAWKGTTAQAFGIFIDLEREARASATTEALFFVIANSTRRLISCKQALIFSVVQKGKVRIEAASNLPTLDRHSPFVHWIENWLSGKKKLNKSQTLSSAKLSVDDKKQWNEWCPQYILWQPLKDPQGNFLGGLWLARDEPWKEPEQILITQLSGCYGHAWGALIRSTGRQKYLLNNIFEWRRFLYIGAVALIAAAMFYPVSQSALAPAEVIARHPYVIASPLDGVIKSMNVHPYQYVSKGERLFTYDNTALKAKVEFSQRSLELSISELEKTRQDAFLNAQAKAKVKIQEQRVKFREAEVRFAEEMLEKVIVRAESNGTAIFTNQQEWIGRPVQVGEKIMVIADINAPALRIDLAAADAIYIPENAMVTLFLAIDPLSPIPARITRSSYQAQTTVEGHLAFRLDAKFEEAHTPRIGLRGTAKIFGTTVPLYLYLFRKPISTVRQVLGI